MPKISINEIANKLSDLQKNVQDGKKWYVAMAVITVVNSVVIIKILTTL